MNTGKTFLKSLLVFAFAVLGLVYSNGAFAAVVLHGVDGGTYPNDGIFRWTKNATYPNGRCVDTVTKKFATSCTLAPSTGYLYKGPDSAGKFYRTGTCWNKLTNLSVACSTATGTISSSFSHTGVFIEGGNTDIDLVLGQISAAEQQMTVTPGYLGSPLLLTIDIPSILVKGRHTGTGADLGEGIFQYRVEITIPLATLDPDDDKGGGNNRQALTCATKCDPQNPKFGKECTGCVANQTCVNNTPEFNRFQYTAKGFCQQGVQVSGYLTWIGPDPNVPYTGTPPIFTNCRPNANDCTLRLGGLPLASDGKVDPVACAAMFPAKGELDVKQIAFFQNNYVGMCPANWDPRITDALGVPINVEVFGLEDPQIAKRGIHRVCQSDYGKGTAGNVFAPADPSFLDGEGFDDTLRGCVVVDGKYHVVEGDETAKSTEVVVDVTPETVNLACILDGRDNGVATATICQTPEFHDAYKVNTSVNPPVLFVEGDTSCGGNPCTVQPIGFSYAASTTGLCAGGTASDLRITYPTCTADLKGLSQVIKKAKPTIKDQQPVTLRLQAQQVKLNTSEPTVILYGSDPVRVTNTGN